MTAMRMIKPAGAVAAVALLGLAGMSITSPRVEADSDEPDSRIQIGFDIAPVKLNLAGLDRALVGVGSYIVNAQSDATVATTARTWAASSLFRPECPTS
jgi:hypothetical protein